MSSARLSLVALVLCLAVCHASREFPRTERKTPFASSGCNVIDLIAGLIQGRAASTVEGVSASDNAVSAAGAVDGTAAVARNLDVEDNFMSAVKPEAYEDVFPAMKPSATDNSAATAVDPKGGFTLRSLLAPLLNALPSSAGTAVAGDEEIEVGALADAADADDIVGSASRSEVSGATIADADEDYYQGEFPLTKSANADSGEESVELGALFAAAADVGNVVPAVTHSGSDSDSPQPKLVAAVSGDAAVEASVNLEALHGSRLNLVI